ncbi:MAG: VOC family protein [Chitinophaga sp.]|uniref:VOC family protein n=1 Tax=Chitinophaga sp. TaxID=1869181 RepID=UPI001AFDA3D2|nr:VOC family protein [Chitinophaga sp.]MBO9731170.1 VOC family protein [Chitinophaga sp.]
MTNITGIHHIAIQANDYKATIRFYEGLGLRQFHSWTLPEFNIEYAALLNIPGSNGYIEIFDRNAHIPAQGRRALPGESPVTGALRHFALTVKDATVAYNEAIALGAKSCVPPSVLHLGKPPLTIHNSLVYGPDGEVIEFIEPHGNVTVMGDR